MRWACPPVTSRVTCTRSRTPASAPRLLHPEPDAGIGAPVTGESHAWVEWWDGGWTGFDPTNSVEIGPRHVALGRGRDYGDVTPFKGLFSGPTSEGGWRSIMFMETRDRPSPRTPWHGAQLKAA